MKRVLSLILGGGSGTRLYPLTKHRSEPAVPVAGKYRLIDIPISNCINSGLLRVYVLTQFLSASLHRHIAQTYKFSPFSQGFVEVLAAQQTNETAEWYQGTADALRQNLRYIEADDCSDVLVLYSDQLYRMDFRELLRTHHDSKADVTVGAVPVGRGQALGLGLLELSGDDQIVRLVEKPLSEEQFNSLRLGGQWLEQRGLANQNREFLANMGIYLFKREVLIELLHAQPPAADLVMEVFQRSLKTHHLRAHLFKGYWCDLGTIKSYHEASLALAGDQPPFDFSPPDGVIYTRMRNLPAARIQAAHLEQCLISDGCIVSAGTQIQRTVLGVRCRIGENVVLKEAVVLGADRYETDQDRTENRIRGVPDLGVGDGSVIERAILDKDCRVGRGVKLVNKREIRNDEGSNFVIRDGIIVIPNGAIVPDGTVV